MKMDHKQTSYERQLSKLKEIIPTLASPSLVGLCSAWIERFTTCGPEEAIYRTKIVDLFLKHLSRDGKLGQPFLGNNIKLPFREILVDYSAEFETIKQSSRCDLSLANSSEYNMLESKSDLSTKKSEDKYQMLCEHICKVLGRFEFNLHQISKSENPLELMKKLEIKELTGICPYAGMEIRSIVERIQHHWNDIYKQIDDKTNQPNERKSCSVKNKPSPIIKHRSVSTDSDSETTNNTISSISLVSPRKCYKSSHDTSSLTCDTGEVDGQSSPDKYKHFAQKCAKRMKKMQQEIVALKQAMDIRESTESIRYAALKSELVERAGAKQQAEMCAMIDQLDERYREIITKTMVLSFGTQQQSQK